MAFGDFAGGVVRQKNFQAQQDVANRAASVNEGNLTLGQNRLGFQKEQFGLEQESAASQGLLKAANDLATSMAEITKAGKEIPPSLIAASEQMHGAAQDKPMLQQQIEATFASALASQTPTEVAQTEGEAAVTTAEAIAGQPLESDQRQILAGIQATREDRLIQLQEAFAAADDPREKTEIGLLINKIISPSSGITINTAKTSGGTVLDEDRQEFLRGVAANGRAAQDAINTADLLDQSLDSVEGTALDTGAFSGLREGLANMAILGGFGDEFAEDFASLTTVDALSQKMRIMETQLLKGAINQREFDAAGKINTTIENPNLANRFAVKRMRATAEMNSWMRQRAIQIESGNPDASDSDIAKELQGEFNNIPYFSKTLKDARGLPLFFTEFRSSYQERFPTDTTQDVLSAWKASQ